MKSSSPGTGYKIDGAEYVLLFKEAGDGVIFNFSLQRRSPLQFCKDQQVVRTSLELKGELSEWDNCVIYQNSAGNGRKAARHDRVQFGRGQVLDVRPDD